ncbi:hypothetical protein N7530_006787 [Penicillium desertorum]|uniref:Uncharacterized protein n=1 Tax=Penicillium desertorum TaxID=1303715 RepID=A0A9W9WSD0_9EURO|nr:hypothetical protein N7530_006787 [Penicillium desertorum]
MPNQREPCMRRGIRWTAPQFQQQMNDSLPRVEAALMQVVGQQDELQCTMCLLLSGPFSNCVSVRGIDDLSACANCHWIQEDTSAITRLSSRLKHLEILQHMEEGTRLMKAFTDELRMVLESSQSLEAQLEGLQRRLTDANTAIAVTGQPM